jgi:hypothetical protein
MECQFCNKTFKNKSILTTHQNTAKYCLKIQGKENIVSEYICCCDKIFYKKSHLTSHESTCIVKNYVLKLQEKDQIIIEKDKIIKEQENLINFLKGENNIYKEEHKAFIDIAKQPKTSNNSNNNNNKILSISSHLDFRDIDKVRNALEKFDANYFLEGQKGMAKFAAENILRDENGNYIYICTDPNRLMFKYKDECGDIQKDYNAKKLTNYLVEGGIKNKGNEITTNLMNKNNTDLLLEKNIEISELEFNNNIFKKELASIII